MFWNSGSDFSRNDIPDLTGQVIIVTGGNAGLGFETIRQLLDHNPARIYLAARSQAKAEAAIRALEQSSSRSGIVTFLNLDLADFKSVKEAAAAFQAKESRLDILINNAGIMMVAAGLTKEHYEVQFGTNHMGTALLTQLLLPTLEKTARLNPETRVVVVASATESRAPSTIYNFDELKTDMADYNTTTRYAISKIANVHYTTAMAKRNPNVKFITVHPGMVATSLHNNASGFFLKIFLNTAISAFATPADKGALSQIWASVSPDAKSGEYYGPVGKANQGSKLACDVKLQDKLYEWTQQELSQYTRS